MDWSVTADQIYILKSWLSVSQNVSTFRGSEEKIEENMVEWFIEAKGKK